ncbi:MAG: Holliday junction resolvase RuvX [Pirellulales bacterium]|nr:Holliday junction resolvase RuvX [Pirellulales bacterium]
MTSEPHNSVPPGRLAGIDFGTVRIGIAVTDADQKFSSPLENYTLRGEAADGKFFRNLATNERIVTFVVGLPIHLDGHESQKSIEARKFGDWLQQITNVPVVFFDERFTSAEAEQLLVGAEFTKKQRTARLDKLAAQILLASYLEAGKPASFKPQSLS